MVLPRTAFLWRSVSFRPLTGIVPDCVLTETMDGLFSPPYRDGTLSCLPSSAYVKFSPPYGDGTIIVTAIHDSIMFSPPYGDGTEIAIAEAESARFSPPYGDGTSKGWYL